MSDLSSAKQAVGGRDRRGRQAGALDMTTLAGLAGAAVLIAVAIAMGGSVAAFFNLPSILIVVGGTIAVTAVSFSIEELLRVQPVILQALLRRPTDPIEAARRVLWLADQARQRGPIHLESQLPSMASMPFLQRALRLVVDGAPAEEVQLAMNSDVEAMRLRHRRSVSVLRRAADVAPAMGLIGTLVGLIQMLGQLEDPTAIGPGMAVALLTTFYGAIAAHMLLLPLAGKLERNSEAEMLVSRIFLLGALSIARQDSPRRLETMLNTVLPPARRIRYFD
jgi:chemotaxis protein MotA